MDKEQEIFNLTSVKDAVYTVFMMHAANYTEMDLDDICLHIQQDIADCDGCDLNVLRKKVSSYLSNATTKIVKGKRTEDKDSIYQRVRNGKGGYKKGVYRLRRPKKAKAVPPIVNPIQPLPKGDPITESTVYVGSAGEMAVCSELLFREYNVSQMSVDDGVDIVAIKNNKTYYIQVKTVQIRNNSFGVKINEKSFHKYDSNDCYYIIVARSVSNIFLVFTADDIKRMESLEDIKISNGVVNVSFNQTDGHIFIKHSQIDYAINNFDRIK